LLLDPLSSCSDLVFSCLSQVNLDFSSEEDMVKKFQVGLALQPVSDISQ
jgi:glutamate--cysteine ligase